MSGKAILIFLGVGLVAGFLASLIVGGGGLIYYLIIGVIGSFVGGLLFDKLGFTIGTGNAIVNQILTAMIGAIIVVVIARIIA